LLRDIAWIAWIALAGAVVWFLGVSRVRRTWFVPAALAVIAVTPSVIGCVADYLHPEGMVAIAASVAGLALAAKERLVLAGVVLAVGVLSQQSAVLVLVALAASLSVPRLARLALGTAIGGLAIVGPLMIATSGRVITGLGGAGFNQLGLDTWVSILRPEGRMLMLVSRILPIFAAIGVGLLARHRLGDRVLDPARLAALAAAAFAMRLVFEGSIYGYYFAAVAVTLVLADAAAGRVRAITILWWVLAAVAFNALGIAAPLNPVHDLPAQQIVVVGVALVAAFTALLAPFDEVNEAALQPVVPASGPTG
jgi:hypothetical protein